VHSLPIWHQSFSKALIPPPKECCQNMDNYCNKKNYFILRSIIKSKANCFVFGKSYLQIKRAKMVIFMVLHIQGIFLWCLTCLIELFCIFLKVWLGIHFFHFKYLHVLTIFQNYILFLVNASSHFILYKWSYETLNFLLKHI